MNYSNINMKAAGTVESSMGPIQEGVNLEAAINSRVLKIAPCGVCPLCEAGSMCERRLQVRLKMIADAKKGQEKKKTKKRKAEGTKDKTTKTGQATKKKKKDPSSAAPKSVLETATSSGTSPSGRVRAHQGNRKMVVPDEVCFTDGLLCECRANPLNVFDQQLIPELCRRITANGTSERSALINRFIEEHPAVSQRQIAFKFSELTIKEVALSNEFY